MVYYVVNFISDTVKLQGGNNTYGKLFISVRIPFKTTHLRSMKYNNNWYGEPENNTHIVILSTRTIINLCLYVSVVTYVADIPRSVLSRNQ